MHSDMGHSLEPKLGRYALFDSLCNSSRPCQLTRDIGVSLLTQILYAMVFVTRYLDLFRASHWREGQTYLIFFKLFYIFTSFYIIALMTYVYARTREREKSWKLATWCVLGSAVGAPMALGIWVAAIKEPYPKYWFTEVSIKFMDVDMRMELLTRNNLIDDMGIFHNPRVCMCVAATAVTPPDHSANGD